MIVGLGCGEERISLLVTPLPGNSVDRVIEVLRQVRTAADNARGARWDASADGGPTHSYLAWAADSLRLLRGVLRPTDVDRLVLTQGYWSLLAQGAVAPGVGARVRAFVDLELEARIADLDQALTELQTRQQRWAQVGRFMVADTSFYIEAAQKLEEFDFAALLGVREEPLHLMVPIVVVEELDGQKTRGRDGKCRWRASYTLAVLSRCLSDPTAIGGLRAEDFTPLDRGEIPRGAITVELILDPPGHTRLPINDNELIDRAAAIGHASGRQMAFLTNDTAQAFRARAAGLDVFELPKPILGDEPARKST